MLHNDIGKYARNQCGQRLQSNGQPAENDKESHISASHIQNKITNDHRKLTQSVLKGTVTDSGCPVGEAPMVESAADLANSFACVWEDCGKVLSSEPSILQRSIHFFRHLI